MIFRKNVWLLFVGFLCTSCVYPLLFPPPKIEDVRAEVKRLAPVDEPLTSAVSRLGAAGFGCTGIKPVQCGREVHGCMEQVVIDHEDENFLVTNAEVTGVNCLYVP